MRYLLGILMVICMVGVASAADLGNTMGPKTDIQAEPAFDGREGGETVADAYPIPGLPFGDSGATCDNVDDYDEACPYTISSSPDVVYAYTADFDGFLQVDLCLSLYDTKVYMYDSGFNLVDCNDDFYFGDPPECGTYTSMLEAAPVMNGETYYIVVDGYGGSCGTYDIQIDAFEPPPPCDLICTTEVHQDENEPPLADEYVDEWNGGCNSAVPVFQWIECDIFCGVAGWYVYTGLNYRDTDWFKCTASGNQITWTVDAESATNIFELVVPPDCAATVTQSATVGPCLPGTLTIFTTPGAIVDLWVGSANFANPGDVIGNEYDYIFTIDGIESVSATVNETWGGVKSLFN